MVTYRKFTVGDLFGTRFLDLCQRGLRYVASTKMSMSPHRGASLEHRRHARFPLTALVRPSSLSPIRRLAGDPPCDLSGCYVDISAEVKATPIPMPIWKDDRLHSLRRYVLPVRRILISVPQERMSVIYIASHLGSHRRIAANLRIDLGRGLNKMSAESAHSPVPRKPPRWPQLIS